MIYNLSWGHSCTILAGYQHLSFTSWCITCWFTSSLLFLTSFTMAFTLTASGGSKCPILQHVTGVGLYNEVYPSILPLGLMFLIPLVWTCRHVRHLLKLYLLLFLSGTAVLQFLHISQWFHLIVDNEAKQGYDSPLFAALAHTFPLRHSMSHYLTHSAMSCVLTHNVLKWLATAFQSWMSILAQLGT